MATVYQEKNKKAYSCEHAFIFFDDLTDSNSDSTAFGWNDMNNNLMNRKPLPLSAPYTLVADSKTGYIVGTDKAADKSIRCTRKTNIQVVGIVDDNKAVDTLLDNSTDRDSFDSR